MNLGSENNPRSVFHVRERSCSWWGIKPLDRLGLSEQEPAAPCLPVIPAAFLGSCAGGRWWPQAWAIPASEVELQRCRKSKMDDNLWKSVEMTWLLLCHPYVTQLLANPGVQSGAAGSGASNTCSEWRGNEVQPLLTMSVNEHCLRLIEEISVA